MPEKEFAKLFHNNISQRASYRCIDLSQCFKVVFFLFQSALLQQENAELRSQLMNLQEQTSVTQQAIRDRDDAIAK